MSIMMELRQRYCICVDCSPGRCQGDCPVCSVRTHECRCAGCPRDPCAPDCRHPDCSRQDAGRAEANMAQRAGLLRWNRVVHETRIQEFHLFQHERGAEFTLVEPDGKRIARTGRELEAMTFRVWLTSSPLYRPPPDPLGLDRAARRQDRKVERGAGSGKASARRRRLREQRVRAGLHPDWGRIGPFQHGEHWNWARKGKRNAIRAEDRLRAETGGNLGHISREDAIRPDARNATSCGLSREAAVCITPQDHRAGRNGGMAVCPECAARAAWNDREGQADTAGENAWNASPGTGTQPRAGEGTRPASC